MMSVMVRSGSFPTLFSFGVLLLFGIEAQAQQSPVTPGARGSAGEPPRPALAALRLPPGESPVIDGRLDDPVWERAEVATGFIQVMPDPGVPETERTEARVLYDDQAIYIGMRMYDSRPDSIAAQLGRRDMARGYNDWVHVLIDSYHDRRTGFRFGVNPLGVKKDVLHFDDTREDLGWDAVWEVATQVDSLGWTAEFRIPLSQLRFSTEEREEHVWGIQFWREIARKQEHTYWAPIPPNPGRMVSLFGELRGLRELPSPRRLEVLPYTVTRLTRAPGTAENPFYNPNALAAAVGADLKYGLTSDLTLTATINPDFGQVEADPAQVNLSAFETFFPERRPFFTEGIEIFQLNLQPGDGSPEQLFYTRRIGRAPQRPLSVPDGFVDMPEAAPILGAGKLSGKTATGWSIGVLNAVTGSAAAQVADATGAQWIEPVEPLTNYLVARTMRDFRQGQSMVGGILTATNRQLNDERLEFLHSAAYTGGMNARHRFAGGTLQLSGFLLGSHVEGSEAAIARTQRSPVRYFQRPDATHVEFDPTRTSLSGWSAQVELFKIGGGHWNWGAFAAARSPGFEVNDLGFQQFADGAFAGGFLSYSEFRPGQIFRHWNVNGSVVPAWTFAGERVQLNTNFNASFQLLNYWGGFGGFNRNFAGLSTSQLRGGPAIIEPARTSFWGGIYSDRRRPLNVELNLDGSYEEETGGHSFSLRPVMNLRPSPRAELSLSPTFSWNNPAWQWVGRVGTAQEPRYVFGALEQRTAALVARVNYAFTPDLSFQFYAQPFVSALAYSDFMEVVDPRAPRFQDRFTPIPGEQVGLDPDFTLRQLRSNAVLRWEYRPGSTLFVVWSQGRFGLDPDGSFRFGHDFDSLYGTPPTNVLLVKFNYWLDL